MNINIARWKQWRPTMVLGVVLVIAGGTLLVAYGQQILDSFTTSDRIAATWNTTVDTGAGEIKLSAQSCDDGIWFCSAANICGSALGDGAYILVKRTDIGATQQYKTANTSCDTPQCATDGGQDGDHLVADNTVNFTSYPARDACKAVGGRLPTLAELSCMYTNRTSFGNNFVASNYWSATEASATLAWNVYMSSGSANFSVKTSSFYVRCVRGW